ncbi:MAG: DUF2341 domain-containing protein, partial [Chitinispirillaceae bacterium]|nr:DUF2341 domain-containing protein [Chitinispirillaceae bacterium]
CCITAVLVLFYCTELSMAGGSSSTDNGRILGMICDENCLPAPAVRVTLLPADHDPYRDTSRIRIDTTDTAGDYAFGNLAPGSYTITAVAPDARTRALVGSVIVDSTTAYAPVAMLSKPGALRIQVSENASAAARYVYLPGTTFYGIVENGSGFIDSIPAGIIPSVYYASTVDTADNHVIKTDFSVAPGVIRVIADYSSWNHSKRIFLNTTISGAGVSGNVLHFPVLVRLSGANFVFSQAKQDGSDVRFKKSDDTPLPCEIERWDATAQKAEIWVKVDTVYGNDSAQFFSVFWGNQNASSESNGAAVFDTANGFVSVWHLHQPTGSNAKDATANRYDGVPSDTAPAQTAGAIGMAQGFNGASNSFTMPNTANSKLNFPEKGSYAMSVWVYANALDSIWRAIAGKGHEHYYLQLKGFGNNRATWEFVEFQNQRGWEYTEDSVPPAPGSGTWLNLVGVRSGTSQHLYINGELVIDTPSLMAGAYSRVTSDNFTIGRYNRIVTLPYYQGWSYFNGKIDEVRVLRGTPTAYWIKLCYMNQKANDGLVVFKNP